MSFAWSETANQILNSSNHISGQNEHKAITWALGHEPEKRKSLEGFVCMGSTTKPAQDGKLFLGYGKLRAVASSGEVMPCFKFTRCFFAQPCSPDDRWVRFQNTRGGTYGPFHLCVAPARGARGSRSRCKSALLPMSPSSQEQGLCLRQSAIVRLRA